MRKVSPNSWWSHEVWTHLQNPLPLGQRECSVTGLRECSLSGRSCPNRLPHIPNWKPYWTQVKDHNTALDPHCIVKPNTMTIAYCFMIPNTMTIAHCFMIPNTVTTMNHSTLHREPQYYDKWTTSWHLIQWLRWIFTMQLTVVAIGNAHASLCNKNAPLNRWLNNVPY